MAGSGVIRLCRGLQRMAATSVLAAIALGSVLLPASPAEAQFCNGPQQRLVFVRKLPINSPENKPMYLARLLQIDCFGLPYKLSDAGYVLGVEGEDRHFALSEQQIASFQSTRALPRPLPEYEMPAADWLMGHSLWFAIAILMLLGMAGGAWAMPRRAPTPAKRPVRPARPPQRPGDRPARRPSQ